MPTTSRDHGPTLLAIVVLASITTLSTFGPWGTSGTKTRSSYALVEVVERAGVLSPSLARLSGSGSSFLRSAGW